MAGDAAHQVTVLLRAWRGGDQAALDQLMPVIRVEQLPADARLPFLEIAVKERVAGGRIHDAHIAEVARLAGAGIVVTDNRQHFTVLMKHGVRVLETSSPRSTAPDKWYQAKIAPISSGTGDQDPGATIGAIAVLHHSSTSGCFSISGLHYRRLSG